jgi:signal transduction histidine kinase
MLDLSRIESGKYTINKTAFDINELIRRVIITLGNEIDKKNIDINVDFAEERILVYADQGCIEQVCVNILDNAIKFSEDNKSILISTKINNGSVQISIRDFGKGISRQDH